MTIQRLDHVGTVVDDLAVAIEFFVQLGLELQGDAVVAGLRARGAELVGELERYRDIYRLCYV